MIVCDADLVETYSDLPLGRVDATVVAMAERQSAVELATPGHRHFNVVGPTHVASFELLV